MSLSSGVSSVYGTRSVPGHVLDAEGNDRVSPAYNLVPLPVALRDQRSSSVPILPCHLGRGFPVPMVTFPPVGWLTLLPFLGSCRHQDPAQGLPSPDLVDLSSSELALRPPSGQAQTLPGGSSVLTSLYRYYSWTFSPGRPRCVGLAKPELRPSDFPSRRIRTPAGGVGAPLPSGRQTLEQPRWTDGSHNTAQKR